MCHNISFYICVVCDGSWLVAVNKKLLIDEIFEVFTELDSTKERKSAIGYHINQLINSVAKEIFKKMATLDMEKEFMLAENFYDGSYDEAEELYLSLPACIVNIVAQDYLESKDISEILKSVKIKIKDKEVPFVDVRQTKIKLKP